MVCGSEGKRGCLKRQPLCLRIVLVSLNLICQINSLAMFLSFHTEFDLIGDRSYIIPESIPRSS